jgi:biotin operon repressor
MNDAIEAKLDLLDRMNATLGKLTNAQIRLQLAGEQDLAAEMDTKRKALLAQIDRLRGQVLDNWSVSAEALDEKLQVANRTVQTRIRSIRNRVNVADNAIKIIAQIDRTLNFLKALVV